MNTKRNSKAGNVNGNNCTDGDNKLLDYAQSERRQERIEVEKE